jgi:hypothetical protein
MFYFQNNWTQAESSDNLSVQCLQNGIPIYAIVHGNLVFAWNLPFQYAPQLNKRAHIIISCKRTGVYSDEFRNPGNIVEREVWRASSPHLPLTVVSARKAM